jgi:hypothetical protein
MLLGLLLGLLLGMLGMLLGLLNANGRQTPSWHCWRQRNE